MTTVGSGIATRSAATNPRAPVKLTISVLPELHQALADYVLYAEAYGREEPVAELIPAMLTAFLESDRGFARSRIRS
jgi:hypothetical protein